MARIEVNPELCKSCGLCIPVCPQKLLSMSSKFNSKGYHYMQQDNAEKCVGCKLCAIMCPDAAITVYK